MEKHSPKKGLKIKIKVTEVFSGDKTLQEVFLKILLNQQKILKPKDRLDRGVES